MLSAAETTEVGQDPTFTFNLRGVSVFIDMPVRGNIPPETVISLIGTVNLLQSKGIPYSVDMQIDGFVCEARSKAAANFLVSGFTKLFFIDSDMTWKPEDALRLIAMSTEMDIVTGSYTTRQEPPGFMIKVTDRDAIPVNDHGCAAIDGTGLGFCIIGRNVIEELSSRAQLISYPNGESIPHVFRFGVTDGRFRGEDISFFSDAKDAGFQCWMDPEITLGHIGKKIYRASLLDYVDQHDGVLSVRK